MYGYTIIVYIPLMSIHSWWTFGLFPLFWKQRHDAINIHIQVFLWTHAVNSPRSRLAGSYRNIMFNLRRNQIVPKQLYHFTFPPATYMGSHFSISLPTLVIMSLGFFLILLAFYCGIILGLQKRCKDSTEFPLWIGI